jgi:glucose dehydrogenase
MIDNDYHPHSNSDLKFLRTKDQMIIDFNEYGVLGIDLNTGKQLWKYEPKLRSTDSD